MVTFITVLKYKKHIESFPGTGYAIYQPEHVYALQKQIERFYPHPHRFVCFTDFENMKCDVIKLKHDLPGWWSKMEMYQLKGSPEDVFFYFDLDTVITGDLTEFVNAPFEMAGLGEVNAPGLVEGRLGSGVVAWRGDQTEIYNKFMEKPKEYMDSFYVGGDQHFVHRLRPNFTVIQKMAPGCYSYKHNLPASKEIPENAKIIYFHGVPKPWQVQHSWIDSSLYNKE